VGKHGFLYPITLDEEAGWIGTADRDTVLTASGSVSSLTGAIYPLTDCKDTNMPASLSSTFDIVWDGALNDTAATIANPGTADGVSGRTFSVVGMTTSGADTGVLTLTRSGTAGDVAVSTNTTAMPIIDAVITIANIEFAASDSLVLTASGTAAITRAVIHCQAASAPTLTVT